LLITLAAYEYKTIHGIVNGTPILHVSFVPFQDDPFPTTLPMIGQMGLFEDPDADATSKPFDLYIHGSISTRLMKLPASGEHSEGLPVCVAASQLDGYVLALTPFHNSCNYRSAILHGYASPVTDEEEKMWALQMITDALVPNRWDNSRAPPSKVEMQSTQVLRVRIESASAKIRAGAPGDDKHDLNDTVMRERTWVGVVPTYTVIGKPQVADYNRVENTPSYMQEWIADANKESESYATGAMKIGKK
jgi:nitroimidazol reductase NimA-like FMN-containing flavoprotein (pyridoxamine 5'-phosphate oxidase superfamily)